VAIVLVVLFHADVPFLHSGYVGVDVFFVVSGFVITGLLLRERESTGGTGFLAFYARRTLRILPAALVVIVASLVATALLIGHTASELVASDSRWTALFLGNFRFGSVLENVLIIRRDSPLGQLWSLAVEEQFYLVYPALLALAALAGRRWSLRAVLAVGLTVVVVASFVDSVHLTQLGIYKAYYSPLCRAWELALGCLVALATPWLRRMPGPLAVLVTWTGLVVVVLSGGLISTTTPYPGVAAAVPVVATALVIAGGTATPVGGAETVLGLGPFRWLGRRSYSWYLWHWPILVLYAEWHHTRVTGTPLVTNVLLVGAALLVAMASYAWIENPVRHSKWLAANPAVSLGGAALLVVSCVALTYAF
jgi:peptidoglycan/LPS O-acetylase OafA/YrhL